MGNSGYPINSFGNNGEREEREAERKLFSDQFGFHGKLL
jgi:hypothetical protein